MYGFLDGVRIVELGHILLAPYATQWLGDFGADIVKVEAPEGDYYRNLGLAREPGMTAQWMGVNRNKRSIVLDLKQPEGQETLLAMVRKADVLVHNMRVPAIERLGLGYEAVRAVNQRIVYAAAIGFGQDGPYADFPAFDDLIQSWCGLAEANGRVMGAPAFVPLVVADIITALVLGQALLAAIFRQARTGKGCYIETPMFETMASMMLNQHLNGHAYRPSLEGLGYSRVMSPFRKPAATRDGHISHGVYKYDQWQKFLAAAGRQDLLNGPLMSDARTMLVNFPRLYEIMATEILPTRTTAEWRRIFNELSIPCAPLNSLDDLLQDPHLEAVGLIEDYEHPTRGAMRQVRNPVTAREVETRADRSPPELGQDGIAVLRDYGLQGAAIEGLVARGVVRLPASERAP